MMEHETAVWLSKSLGLFYLIALFLASAAYAFWPSNGKRFERAGKSILDDEDGPCR